MAFLDENGLETFLAYLKAWVRSAFVNTTGDQTVSGTKTFANAIHGNISGNAATASSVPWSGVTGKPGTITNAQIDALFSS